MEILYHPTTDKKDGCHDFTAKSSRGQKMVLQKFMHEMRMLLLP